MQTFTTQSHQRNYEGNVVVETPNYQTRFKKKRNKILSGIASAVMATAVIITSGLLGATTVHNKRLEHEVKTLQTQSTQVNAVAENETNDKPTTLELKHNDEGQTPVANENSSARKLHRTKRVKPLPAIDKN